MHACLHAISSKFDALQGYVEKYEADHKAAADRVASQKEAVRRGLVVDDRRASDLEDDSVSEESDSD